MGPGWRAPGVGVRYFYCAHGCLCTVRDTATAHLNATIFFLFDTLSYDTDTRLNIVSSGWPSWKSWLAK